MKTKVNYYDEYNKIDSIAEEELKEALMKFPNQEYVFLSDEQVDNINDIDNPLVIEIEDYYDGSLFNIYVTSVRVVNDNVEIWGFGVENGDYSYMKLYTVHDVVSRNLHYIIEALPEIEGMEDEKEMEVRIVFTSEVYIKGKGMDDIRKKWQELPIFTCEALDAFATVEELVTVEDAETYNNLKEEFLNNYEL